MIVDFPILLFAIGLLASYGSAGRRRQTGTVVMVLGAAWSLALLVDPGAVSWAAGPLVATFMLPRPAERIGSTFEALTRRTVTIAALMLLGLFLGARLPFGENPLLLNVVPWFLGAVGAAWVLSPIDARERAQGQVLMVAAAGALLLAAVPAGVVTGAAAGAMAVMPVLAERGRVPAAARPLLSSVMLLAAAVAAVIAAAGVSVPSEALGDLSTTLAGPILLAAAVVLVAGAVRAPQGREWVVLLGVLALVATAPSLRWSAVAALLAAATAIDRTGERPAWIAVAALAAAPVVQALAAATWSPRVQAVALAVGLILAIYASSAMMVRVLVLPAIGMIVLVSVGSQSAGNLTRFQWIVAVGALLLLSRAALIRLQPAARPGVVVGDQLVFGLMLLGMSARDAPGLGALATVLLLIDVAVVRFDDVEWQASGFGARVLMLARANWPGSVSFAGGSLAVIAALQASLALGLLAALMLAGLQLAPLLDGRALVPGPERPRASLRWIEPALSIACGIAPALVLRMLRL